MTRSLTFAFAASLTLLTACGDKSEDTTTERIEALEKQTEDMAAQAEQLAEGINDDNPVDREDIGIVRAGEYSVGNATGYEIGTVTITEVDEGVSIELNVTAIPEGAHAFHFHDVGACDGPDFKSAGGHYNPEGHDHGFEATDTPHAGDMLNFDAPASGVVNHSTTNTRVSLQGREGYAPLRDANGTALIIHAEADDYKSQPSGAAGARIACAVIK